jgi:hypothetical protein
LLWTWHRIQLADDKGKQDAIEGPFSLIWRSYYRFASQYITRIQPYCFVENSITRYASNGAESSLIAFEQIGILASIALFQGFHPVSTEEERIFYSNNAHVVIDTLEALLINNGASNSPCLDRHSQDIILALVVFFGLGRVDTTKEWLKRLFRNVDYAFRAKNLFPFPQIP